MPDIDHGMSENLTPRRPNTVLTEERFQCLAVLVGTLNKKRQRANPAPAKRLEFVWERQDLNAN